MTQATRQAVWLFTRDQESVRLAVRSAPAGFRLMIFGPGSASAEFDFAEVSNLDRFREKYEQDLQAQGFSAHAVPERRTSNISDGSRPPSAERRR